MDKFLKIAEMRDLEKQVSEDKISYSRMIEIINLKAQKHYLENYKLTSLNVKCKCRDKKPNYPEMIWCDKCGLEI